MDHDYELASYDRKKEHIFDLERLLKPASYYAEIRPINFALEEEIKKEKKEKKEAALELKAKKTASED
jgi:NADH-quinone oxidoreductase subunit I